MKMEKENIKKLIEEKIKDLKLVKLIFSNPIDKTKSKMNIKLVEIKDEILVQIEIFEKNKAIHNNIKIDEFNEILSDFLDEYKQILVKAIGEDYQILKNKKGYNLKISKNSACEINFLHNKKKQYILNEGEDILFLKKLGVMGENNEIFKNSYDKFRQINKYLEFIDDTIKEMQEKNLISDKIKVVDFGCGKSYLTFALYHYLKNIKKLNCEIIGLDLKEDVINDCNKIAKELNYENLEFLIGDIKDFDKLQNVDMIFSLHACNNATDYALLKGLEMNASAILTVPCCQHEFNEKMSQNKNSDFYKYNGIIGKHGILFEKYTTLATDGFRALALELCGYNTKVMEFIDMEHTPKNTLIRGIKEKKNIKKLEKTYIEYNNFMKYLGIKPLLDELLKNYYLVK